MKILISGATVFFCISLLVCSFLVKDCGQTKKIIIEDTREDEQEMTLTIDELLTCL